MIDHDREFVQLLRDERDIRQVIQTYARGSDRKDFELMRSAYHPDAYDNHGPFSGPVDAYFEWARQHHDKIESMLHLLGFPNVAVDGDVAFAETYCELTQLLKGAGGAPGQRVTMHCRYVDRFEKREGAWKIALRVVAYDAIRREWLHDEVAPGPIGAGFVVGHRSKEDVVYQISKLKSPI